MCGPSDEQKATAASESAFGNLMQSNYTKNSDLQSADLAKLNSVYSPIFQAGPDQGIGATEKANLMTQADQGVGRDYAKASQSLNMGLSARGGGNEVLPSGAANTMKEQLASAGSNEMATQESGVERYSQDVGRENWLTAGAGMKQLGQLYDPSAIASGANSATGSAYSMEHQNAMQASQQFSAYAGGVAALGKAATGGMATGFDMANAGAGQMVPVGG
jgi:hypothetical protein